MTLWWIVEQAAQSVQAVIETIYMSLSFGREALPPDFQIPVFFYISDAVIDLVPLIGYVLIFICAGIPVLRESIHFANIDIRTMFWLRRTPKKRDSSVV